VEAAKESTPDLMRLTYFVHISETRSLTKASIGLDVSTSVLSRKIQQLETSLGQRLLQRTGRGVTLTEFGRALLPNAQALLAEAARFMDAAAATAGRPSGRVVVGLPGSIAAMIAGPLFRAVQRRYPSISLRLVEGLSGAIEELLLLGRIDIGLYYTRRARARRGRRSARG
jgi:LysR family transcriptional regulator, nitrogen assimilation regulatory protein